MSDTLPIDSNIPLPEARAKQRRMQGGAVSRTLDALQPGQSFVMPDFIDRALSSQIRNATARNFARYTYRKIDADSARIWRVS